MSEDLIISDACLAELAKMGEDLDSEVKVQEFLSSWHGTGIYFTEIFECIRCTSSHGGKLASTWLERKEALRSAQVSKKAKYLDDPVVAKAARITGMRDQWLLQHNKMNPDLKARLKKAQETAKREKAKMDNAQIKAQEQA